MTAIRALLSRRRPGKKQRYSRTERSQRRAAYVLLAPAAAHVTFWIAIPVAVTLVLSLTDYDVLSAPGWIGLANYAELAGDAVFRRATWNTVIYTFFTVPVAMAIAVVIAVLLNQGLRLRTWYRAAFFMPQVTATVAIAMVWLWMYEPRIGLFNSLLGFAGVRGPAWLADAGWAMPAVILAGIWHGIGLKMLIYLAALQNIPGELYEAAQLDGASPVRRFFSITLPLLAPATFFVFVVSVIDAFQVFDQIYVLTRGGPADATTMMTYEIYRNAFEDFRMGYACAQSVVLFGFLLVLTVANRRLTGGDRAD